jgi:hypothetical protein
MIPFKITYIPDTASLYKPRVKLILLKLKKGKEINHSTEEKIHYLKSRKLWSGNGS